VSVGLSHHAEVLLNVVSGFTAAQVKECRASLLVTTRFEKPGADVSGFVVNARQPKT
jgi:hypothetical protein